MAKTIDQGFRDLRSNLEITGLQEETVSTRQQNVRDAVEAGPLGADRLDALDEPCLLDRLAAGLVIVGRPREPHQPASFGDRETTGPAMTDVASLLGRGASREAPFKNSFSNASLPTRRSSAAIRASWVC